MSNGGGCVETGLGCVTLVFFGAVIFVGCELTDGPEPDWKKSATEATSSAPAATQSAKPDWRLKDSASYEYIDPIDTGKPEKIDLLELISAEDINRTTYFYDYLDDGKGLTMADVEVKILSKPKHGTANLNKGDGTVTYTSWTGFEGPDEFRYSLKLKGKPEVVERTHSMWVSPGIG